MNEALFIFVYAILTKTWAEAFLHWRMNCSISDDASLKKTWTESFFLKIEILLWQWWCCCFSFSEWRDGSKTWAAGDCKDQRVCWCCTGKTTFSICLLAFRAIENISRGLWRFVFNIIHCQYQVLGVMIDVSLNWLCRRQTSLLLLQLLQFLKLYQMLAWRHLKLIFMK